MLQTADLIEMRAVEQARRSFWAYRQYINPKLKKGWWQREVTRECQKFAEDLVAGKRPILVIEAPPQHGKSSLVIDLISWIAGHYPDIPTIYTSFSERLGIRANLRLQRIFDNQKYRKIFPETRIPLRGAINPEYERNREKLDYVGHDGSFRNTTVLGSITGEGLGLGIIDDPMKGREAANSETTRNKTWEWFTDDFFTRFSDEAGMLAILTRWHVDDPIGRLKANEDFKHRVKTLTYQAIATKDETHRKIGEALFPEHKSLDFLLLRKSLLPASSWESLYQQNPIVVGGEVIKVEWFRSYRTLPILKERRIYADTAMKKGEHNDYSVFECWGRNDTGIYLVDAIRGKWEAPELERQAIAFWHKMNALNRSEYGPLNALKIEDKASGTGLIQGIRHRTSIPIIGIQRDTDRYSRYSAGLGYLESGRVFVPETHPFTSTLLTEAEQYQPDDSHEHDDTLDPMFDAINDFLGGKTTVWDVLY